MTKKNFETIVEYGSYAIRAGSYNNLTKKIENDIEFLIDNQKFDKQSHKNEIIEKLVLNIEKKNNEYLDEIFLMTDELNILPVYITNFEKNDDQLLPNDIFKNIIEQTKYQINVNYSHHEIVHTLIKNYILDDKKFNELPKNLNFKKFGIEFLFILYPKIFIENIKEAFGKQNVIIKKFIFSSYAKSLFYLEEIDDKKAIFVDIGYEKTCAFLFTDRKLDSFKILPIGGNHITKDICKILNIDHTSAEKIKLNFDGIDIESYKKLDEIELIKKIIFSRIEELLEISTLFSQVSKNLDNIKLFFFGNGSKILDSKFNSNITFNHNINLLEENHIETFLSGQNILKDEKNNEIGKIYQTKSKQGFFEKFFHLFN